MDFNETKLRFSDVAMELQAALASKDVSVQVVASEQGGCFTKVTAKMSSGDIKWLCENKVTILKGIGSDSLRVVELGDGTVSIEVGLPFGRRKKSRTPPRKTFTSIAWMPSSSASNRPIRRNSKSICRQRTLPMDLI